MCVCVRFANVARFKTGMFAKLVYVARSLSLNESDDNGGVGGGVLVKFDVKWGDMSKKDRFSWRSGNEYIMKQKIMKPSPAAIEG